MITNEILTALTQGTQDGLVEWGVRRNQPEHGWTSYYYKKFVIWSKGLQGITLIDNNEIKDRLDKVLVKNLLKAIKASVAARRKKEKEYQIPYDCDGNQLHYPAIDWNHPAPTPAIRADRNIYWQDNEEFEDELEIIKTARGRSAAYFILKSKTTGKHYTMFMKDLMELLQGQVLKERWTFQKRGGNFGIRKVK